jgi:hypothetical protein
MANPLVTLLVGKVADTVISKFVKNDRKKQQMVETTVDTVASTPRSKTMWFAAALAILGTLQSQQVVGVIPAEWQGVFIAVIALIVAILRVVTTKRLADKGD